MTKLGKALVMQVSLYELYPSLEAMVEGEQ